MAESFTHRQRAVDIWRMDINGSNLKQLTRSGGSLNPYCSPDGHWVVYEDYSSGQATVWKMSIDGGNQAQLTGGDKHAVFPAISPDGKLLAYGHLNERNQPQITIIPFEGGPPIKTLVDFPSTGNAWSDYRWTPDGRALIGGNTIGGVSNIWKWPLDGSSPTQLTDFKSSLVWWLDLSRDGKQLALSRGVASSDVVLISNFR